MSTAEMNKLSFDVLSDAGNRVARSFGLVYSLPQELRAALTSNNKALPGINGDNSWELPLPATYVIAPDRKIAHGRDDQLSTCEVDTIELALIGEASRPPRFRGRAPPGGRRDSVPRRCRSRPVSK